MDARVVCAQSKAREGPHFDSCEPFPVPSYPFASVAIDFVSLPEVKHPETGVQVDDAMVISCGLTGCILAIPCRQEGLTSHKAAALLLHYCAFFTGMPREMHSDNQSIISSEFFDALCGLAGITQAKSIVYRPQSNGRAERAVQSIINALRLYLVLRKLDWVYALPFALWGLNDLLGPIAPYSPHRLVFGRDPIGFGEVTPLTVDTGVEDALSTSAGLRTTASSCNQSWLTSMPGSMRPFSKNTRLCSLGRETAYGCETGPTSLAYIPSWTGYGTALQRSSVRLPRVHT